jgi:hypothetical protein
MRAVILLLVGALIGAAAFHLYYLGLNPPARCGWDHPIDADARRTCREESIGGTPHGYAAKARRDLDSLIGKIAH